MNDLEGTAHNCGRAPRKGKPIRTTGGKPKRLLHRLLRQTRSSQINREKTLEKLDVLRSRAEERDVMLLAQMFGEYEREPFSTPERMHV